MILKYGGLDPLLSIINTVTNQTLIKHGIWAVSNLCRGKPLPELKLVEVAIPTLCEVLKTQSDTEVLTDSAWALSYLSRSEKKIDVVIETGVIPALVKQLE